MLAQPSLVTNAGVGVLVWQQVAHLTWLVTVNQIVNAPLVTVGASQHTAAVGGAADPVAKLIDIKLEAEQAEVLLSLTGCVAVNLEN